LLFVVTEIDIKLNIFIIKMDENIKKLVTCPITSHIYKEPVTLSDGYTYEKHAIKNILLTNRVSPITNKQLYDNVKKLLNIC
jgi:hypothetical protein